MFIAASRRKIRGKTYTYYNLVESLRTDDGPRQRVVLPLGKLEGVAGENLKLLSKLVTQRLSGAKHLLPAATQDLAQEADRIAELVIAKRADSAPRARYHSVNLGGISSGPALLLGSIHVALSMWRRLGVDECLQARGFSSRQRALASIQVMARLVAPASELATTAWVTGTALRDLLGDKLTFVNKDALYRISDRLWRNRVGIEAHLVARERSLFGLTDTVVLYDLTSTYFEGLAASNPAAARGYSRDHRPDCKQVVVGMVLDAAGFPKASEIYKGNTYDGNTLTSMLQGLQQRVADTTAATVVMDRGIATKANVAKLKEAGYHYVVALPQAARQRWVGQVAEGDFEQIDTAGNCHPGVHVCIRKQDAETYLIVRSQARVAKDAAIRQRFMERMQQELTQLHASVAAGKLSDAKRIHERVGRIRQRNQRASRFVRVSVIEAEGKQRLQWSIDTQLQQQAATLDGTYVLRTDRNDLDRQQLWSLYISLTKVESSFRYLKTSLGMRPIYHQRQSRVEGHLFISILAYHLMHALEQVLLSHEDHRSWPTINSLLDTHRFLSLRIPDQSGQVHHVRLATNPTAEQRGIYKALGISAKPLPRKSYSPESGDQPV